MACRLTAQRHYLGLCRFVISEVSCHSPEESVTKRYLPSIRRNGQAMFLSCFFVLLPEIQIFLVYINTRDEKYGGFWDHALKDTVPRWYSPPEKKRLTGWLLDIIPWDLIYVRPKLNGFPRLCVVPDTKVHGANMGPTWALSAPDGTHVGHMNLAIRGTNSQH